MAKFFPPLGSGSVHKITNTYHGESASNPGDFSKQVAVDFSAVGGKPVYAVADGTIVNATPNAGGYCTLDIGQGYWVLYVHTYAWLPIGTKVKRGQQIAAVKKMYGSHLHFGLKNKNYKAPHPRPMDFMDRGLITPLLTSGHPDITKVWWKDGQFNWSIHKDLNLDQTPVVTPPPTVPPVDPCKEKVEKAVLAERVKWEAKVKDMLATIELYKKEEGEQKSAVAKLLERFRG